MDTWQTTTSQPERETEDTKQLVIDIFNSPNCHNHTWKSLKDTGLLNDVNFVKLALKEAKTKKAVLGLWNILGEIVKKDSSVVAAALRRHALTFSHVPESFANDEDWCLERLRAGHLSWRILPNTRKRDVEYALAARGGIPFRLVLRKVQDKQRLWMEWACKYPKTVSDTDWRELAPLWIKGDEKIMMDVICLDPCKVMSLDDSLATNSAYIQSLFKANILTLPHFRAASYESVPGLFTIQNIKMYLEVEGECTVNISAAVPKHLWQDCEFVMGWIRAGLRLPWHFLDRVLTPDARDNKEIFLEYARSGNQREQVKLQDPSSEERPYLCMSYALNNDKEFVERLLECGGDPVDVMFAASWELKDDEYLQVLAASTSSSYILFRHCSLHRRQLVLQKIESQKREFEGFFLGVLCGSHPGSGSQLTLLTDSNIRRHVASYFDFPIGKHCSHLCKALELREASHPN